MFLVWLDSSNCRAAGPAALSNQSAKVVASAGGASQGFIP
jgi:hypothetical protein